MVETFSSDEPLPLEVLEPFGWVFTPGALPIRVISAEQALRAAGAPDDARHQSSVTSGAYTEKGRFRQQADDRRVTLYVEHPVWVVTLAPDTAPVVRSDDTPRAEQHWRHTLVDARSGALITQFLQRQEPADAHALDLHDALADPEMTAEEAVAAAVAGEERILDGLPHEVTYGSRWRLLPGFMQVTDVWRVAFDTSTLPPISPDAKPELAWVVLVDDKAGHRWMSAAVHPH